MSLLSRIFARRMRLVKPRTLDVACLRDLAVPMDDGAILLADRWVARDQAAIGGARPTVLVRSPYGRRQLVGLLFGRLLAERGLQVVIQSVRGTFGSDGDFSPFDERADGLATLRWMRDQPWHAGPVGTIGPSYLGLVQWALAADAGDDLKAMSIQVSASQFHGQTYPEGSLSLETAISWMVLIATQERRLAPLAIGRALRALPEVIAQLPVSDLDERAAGAPLAWFREGFDSPAVDDDYWVRRDYSVTVPRVTAPVQFVGGWYDILLPWMLQDYAALRAAGHEPQLLIGPWTHTAPGLAAAGQRDGIAWLRAHLLGDDRLVRRSSVRVMVTGADGGWRDLPEWPPSNVGELRLHVGPAASLTLDGPSPQAGSDGYRYDPADPTPSLGGPVLLARHAVVDNAPLEARADVLAFTGPELSEPLEAIGEVWAELWLAASEPYFDVFARVCDVDAGGVSRNVCDALTTVAPGRHERTADGSWRVRLALWPTAHRFAAGHRIRLLVCSGAHPRYARNPGTGGDLVTATADSLVAVEVRLLHGPAHPSAVVLPATAPGLGPRR
ncbi:MAG: CocE/NonD family hydrolase [Solirubrobacteraceae bacterium]